jgi:hypothetical protein
LEADKAPVRYEFKLSSATGKAAMTSVEVKKGGSFKGIVLNSRPFVSEARIVFNLIVIAHPADFGVADFRVA